jgi:hypothetical protein
LRTKTKNDETLPAETINNYLLSADIVRVSNIVRHTEETLQRLRTLPVREQSLKKHGINSQKVGPFA